MSARETILQKVRQALTTAVDLPNLQQEYIRYSQPEEQYNTVLAGVGGTAHCVPNFKAAETLIRTLPCWNATQPTVCLQPEIQLQTCDINSVNDPHELANVELAIMPGQFAVAENAAVWVTDARVKHRVIYFLTQHLILVVPRLQIVHNMHEAYQRLAFPGASYGLFISGPSKTADIEQSLVIGAHGPRSLHVIFVGESAAV
jgi:L-lactate dehydrogenase complex protein LldG